MLERQTRVLLRWWGRVLGRHSGLVLLVCLALTLGSATFLPRIQVQTEVTNLLPTDLPEVKAFLETQEVFGGDMTVCVVRAPGGTQVLDAQELIDLVVERFQALETVGQVQYNLLEGMPYKALIRHLPALLSPEEIPEFVARLAPDQIRARLLEDRSLLATTPDATVTELIREDPLALLLLLQDRFQKRKQNLNLDLRQGYLLSRDGGTLLILIEPLRPPADIEYGKRLLADLEGAVAAAGDEYRDLYQEEPPALEVGFTGSHPISAVESTLITREGLRAAAVSIVSVLLLFWFTFRRFGAFLYVGIPLAAGICWNVALTYLCIGHLNFVAVGFAAIIMGLGVDFAIHLYNRYLDLRVGGQEPASAIEDALADTGPGIVTGALSTAGAFYAMMWVNFKGMREFGFITGSGVLLTLLVMTTLFPAMLLARERITGTYRPRRLRNFGINRWVAQVVRRPRLYFWGIVAVTVVLGFFAVQLRPADALDLAKRAKLNPGVRWQLFLQDHLGSSFKSLMVVLHASDPRVVEAAGTRIYQELREFQRRGRIYLVESLFDYLPPREEQDRALAAFAQALPPDRGAAVPEDLARALDETGFDPAAFAGYQAALAAALADPTPLSLEAISVSGDLKRIADRYLRRRAGDYWLAMYIYPRGKSFSQGELDLLQDRTASIRESSPAEVALVGGVILNHTLKRLTQTGFGAITALAVLTVVGLIFIHFRRIGLTLLTFSPLAVTAIWLGGLMYLLREPITVMNLPVMPMLMGIGIDDAIHVIHCHRHAGRGEVPRTFRLVGKAVVLTTLTTMVGFGSLALCNHPGLHSMGLLTVIGVFLALVTSATLLPAVLTILPLPPDETP